jgi:arylsulfatase A-like enzyme
MSGRAALVASGILLAAPLSAPAEPAPRPNFIVILADDLGSADLGSYGNDFHETPHLDRLASAGVRFSNAYACGPNCAPTRASLLTGRYTPRHGVTTVMSRRSWSEKKLRTPGFNRNLLLEEVTVAEALRSAGYSTAAVGKWHLGGHSHGPAAQGFDVSVATGGFETERAYFSPYSIRGFEDGPKGEYLTDRLTDEALKLIDAFRHRPFFLYLSHHAVHGPVQAKAAETARYEAKAEAEGRDGAEPAYAAMIDSLDQGVGRITARLEKLGIADRTVIFFLSDNGGSPVSSNGGLRGSKGSLYEGGIRSPLLISGTPRLRGGALCDEPVICTDVFPTILDLAGIPEPASPVIDGRSLVPLLEGEGGLDRDAIYWHFPHYLGGRGSVSRTTPAGAIRAGNWKLIEYFEGSLELYDLAEDPGEARNRAEDRAERAAALQQELARWRESVGAQMPVARVRPASSGADRSPPAE